MSQANYKVLSLVFRIIIVLLGIIAFVSMFNIQVAYSNGASGFSTFELVAPDAFLGIRPVVLPLIGYIVIALATVGSVAMMFVKDMLGGSKINKIIDICLGVAFVIAGVMVVLSVVWFGLINNFNDTVLPFAPIVACSCAGVAAILSIWVSFFENKL